MDDYEYLTVITNKNTAKRVKLTEFSLSSRARRGSKIIKEVIQEYINRWGL